MLRIGLAATVLVMVAPGCSLFKKKEPEAAAEVEDSKYKAAITRKTLPDGLLLEEVDINEDAQPDLFNYYREREDAPRLLVRKDTDLNLDGRIDVKSWYDDFGNLEIEEMDLDFDGQFDLTDHFQDVDGDGQPERVSSEVDTDYDGVPNVWTIYENGVPSRKERDTNGDGRVDVWEKFDAEGNVIRAGRDENFDGSVDERYD